MKLLKAIVVQKKREHSWNVSKVEALQQMKNEVTCNSQTALFWQGHKKKYIIVAKDYIWQKRKCYRRVNISGQPHYAAAAAWVVIQGWAVMEWRHWRTSLRFIYQASFDHVKVGPTLILALHNLWRQIHMFLDILEFRVENKTNYLEKMFW